MRKILLSNDDGFIAPGVNLLRDGLNDVAGVELLTVTPDRDRSASSNSLTLDKPLRLTERGENLYSINGTPADCVHLAITGLCEDSLPDLVVSGINAGPNMGDDVIYSGTVAAAMEGRHLKLPPIAVSMASSDPKHYASGVEAVISLLENLDDFSTLIDDDSKTHSNDKNIATILNVNVPDLPWEQIKGFKATRLGKRQMSQPIIKEKDPRGKDIYWIGRVGETADAEEGTDFFATEASYVSVTPLHIDLTQYSTLALTNKWLSESQMNAKKPHKSGEVA